MNVWVDIDNPPQARYLLPVARRLEEGGHDVLFTARAYGDTFAMLDGEGVPFEAVGTSFGKGVAHKVSGLAQRTRLLIDYLERRRPPVQLVITGSRAATLAARALGIPSFVIIDYEYVNVAMYALAGAHILHPDVIDPQVFRRRGIPRRRIVAFPGLKEDLSFAGVDVEAVAPYDAPGLVSSEFRILFRPPAEDSHYYRAASRALALQLLEYLAQRDVRVVLSPRGPDQIAYLEHVRAWRVEPFVLDSAAPFISLLKSVDAVASAGGTMSREAAYLGVPAYSIFRGKLGAVDRHLAALGRLSLLTSPADFGAIDLASSRVVPPLRAESATLDVVAAAILERAHDARRPLGRRLRPGPERPT